MSGAPTMTTDPIVVTAESTIDSGTAEAVWDLYRVAFGDLQERAAARHLLNWRDFALEVLDTRVVKYVARTTGGRIAGLCTLSNDLDTVPWISPELYRARYPAHFARRAVFYCGIAMVHPDARSTSAFPDMLAAFGRDIAAAGGILAADMCRVNVDELQLARFVALMMKRVWGSVRQVELDRQVYLAWEPDQPVASL
jgi:hypothetical protein